MTNVVLATESADLAEHLHAATAGAVTALPLGPLPDEPAHLLDRLPGACAPEVVVLDAGPRADEALRLAHRFSQQCPDIGVLLLSDREAEIGLPALRAGVRDIVHPSADAELIRAVLHRTVAAVRSRARSSTPAGGTAGDGPVAGGRVITVASPKGGVGKTTLATNLAVGLTAAEPHSTVLVDLDLQFGDVASALNLGPEFTLPDTVRGPASRDTLVLKTFLTLHSTGLYVICGAHSPVAADGIGSDDVSRLLGMLASEFRFVVVDTAPGLSEHTLAAMDAASDLVLVTGMDVPGVRGLRKELDTLTDLGMPAGRRIVLNFADPAAGLSMKDVEATLGTTVDLVLPRSKAVPASVNQGVPLLESGTRDRVTDELRRLVRTFGPVAAPAPRPERGRHKGRHRGDRGGRR